MKRVLSLVLIFSTATTANAATSAIEVSDAWSRPATGTAVVYATLHNAADVEDALIGAFSPLATHVSLHQSKMSGMSMNGMTGLDKMPTGDAMMSMKRLSAIPVPAHGATKLMPGGYHLMLDLKRDLRPGETIPLRLRFTNAGWIVTSVHVRPIR